MSVTNTPKEDQYADFFSLSYQITKINNITKNRAEYINRDPKEKKMA